VSVRKTNLSFQWGSAEFWSKRRGRDWKFYSDLREKKKNGKSGVKGRGTFKGGVNLHHWKGGRCKGQVPLGDTGKKVKKGEDYFCLGGGTRGNHGGGFLLYSRKSFHPSSLFEKGLPCCVKKEVFRGGGPKGEEKKDTSFQG